jgi:pilus assembly protein FimV
MLGLLMAFSIQEASALMLGRTKVLSGWGEPLRFEIEVLEISPDEAASLNVRLSSPEAFKSAGVNYNPALSNLQIRLMKRPDGTFYLVATGASAFNESFADVMFELSWNGGRMVRDYTLLLDAAPNAPIKPFEPEQAQTAAPAPPSVAPAAVTAGKPASKAVGSAQIQVVAGDTAGEIATAHALKGFSLDQMLVAMQKANPEAFINKNVNRLRAGVVLNLPSADQAAQTSAQEAREIIQAQSKDFNSYREKLASSTRTSKQDVPGRATTGTVNAEVQDARAKAPAADKLTLSKGAMGSVAADQVAQQLMQQEQEQKKQALTDNLKDLEKISEASKDALQPRPVASALTDAAPASNPAPDLVAAPQQSQLIPQIPLKAPPPAQPAESAAADAESSGLNQILLDPVTPWVAGGLIALLFAAVMIKIIRARSRHDLNNPLLEPPVAGTDAPGAQDNNAALKEVKKSIALSQADIMLTYGREAQAILLLKTAIEQEPERVELHLKLAAIFAKSEQKTEFEELAQQVKALTQGAGEDWNSICAMGVLLDPENPLYSNARRPEPPIDDAPPETVQPSKPDSLAEPEIDPEPVPMHIQDKPTESLEDLLNALPDIDLTSEVAEQPTAKPAAMDFDMSALSLDLDLPSTEQAADPDLQAFEIKLSLAEEFNAIGDVEGARTMIEEIIAQAQGDIKARAEAALSKLG